MNKLSQVNLDDLPLTTTPSDCDFPTFGGIVYNTFINLLLLINKLRNKLVHN